MNDKVISSTLEETREGEMINRDKWGAIASLLAGQAIVLTGYWVVFLASAALMIAGSLFHYAAFIGHERARHG